MRRLDIGVASYRNPDKLKVTLESIERQSVTDWRCYIIHNPSGCDDDFQAQRVMAEAAERNPRFERRLISHNEGYAGAVNKLFTLVETPYVAYLDNDVTINTPGWDEKLCQLLDAAPEVGQVFPGAGHYGFFNGQYHECLWNAGYAWVIRNKAATKVANYIGSAGSSGMTPRVVMDLALGHHEEVDLMIRLRLAGYRIGCIPDIEVQHHASSTNSPESAKRIHAGVVRWMNKWNRYFCGDVLTYPNPDPDSGEGYDPRSLRYTDWPPCALYLERMTLAMFPQWNAAPRTVMVPGAGEMDAIEVVKPKGCYVGRAI